MTTAISIAIVLLAIAGGYAVLGLPGDRRRSRRVAVRPGRVRAAVRDPVRRQSRLVRPWPRVFGSPVPAEARLDLARAAAAVLERDAGDPPRGDRGWCSTAGCCPIPTRPAPAALPVLLLHGVLLQRGRVARTAAPSPGARAGAGLYAVVRAAAGVDRAFRRPGRREDRRDPARHRREPGGDRRPQHGRARRAGVPAPLRRRPRSGC